MISISSGVRNLAIEPFIPSASKLMNASPFAQLFFTSSVSSSDSFLVITLFSNFIALIVHLLATVSLNTENPELTKSCVISTNGMPNLKSGLSLPY